MNKDFQKSGNSENLITETFKSVLNEIAPSEVIDELWTEIVQHYSATGRHYHTLDHLDSIVAELIKVKQEINNWLIVVLAIAYHDIVYDVLKNDNEERSADLAYNRLTLLGLSESQKENCRSLILATKTHQLSATDDANLFTDADLAILGAAPEAFANYRGQIREEYKVYPDEIFVPGRIKVLNHFLSMSAIYKTNYFRTRYEEQARKNMIAELKLLS